MNPDWRLGLRATPRGKIFQPASLAIGADSARVHMLDVSMGGARIHSALPLAVGAHVILSWANQSRAARVAWSSQKKSGLRFDMLLTSTDVAALLTTA